jgi:hypothetical protein
MFIAIERDSIGLVGRESGIVCMSAISHKVNTRNDLVNPYFHPDGNLYQPRFTQSQLAGKT